MTDKNGREIKTGDYVLITGGYFKADNGLFKVVRSPGDENWCGRDHCLHKANRDGTESKSKYNTAFWPLMVTVSSRDKYSAAKAHNAEHAEIEVVEVLA